MSTSEQLQSTLALAPIMSEGVRAELEGFVSPYPDLRGVFVQVLVAAAERAGQPTDGVAGLDAELGSGPEDGIAFVERIREVASRLGRATVDEALIRIAFAEGLVVQPGGDACDFVGPVSPDERDAVLGLASQAFTALAESEAVTAVSERPMAIFKLMAVLREPAVFAAYAERLVGWLHGQGWSLAPGKGFVREEAGRALAEQSRELCNEALSGTERGHALERQTGELVGEAERLRFAVEALYASGYVLSDTLEPRRVG